MKKLLFLLIPFLMLLSGCTTKLDQHYIDKLEPIYNDWLYSPCTDESDRWLDQKTRKIASDMRKDGYNGLEINKILEQAKQNAMTSIEWRQSKGIDPTPLKPRYGLLK